jgi:hypothetical protein
MLLVQTFHIPEDRHFAFAKWGSSILVEPIEAGFPDTANRAARKGPGVIPGLRFNSTTIAKAYTRTSPANRAAQAR